VTEIIFTIGFLIALFAGLFVPVYILMKYLDSRKTKGEISIAKVIISFAVWAFLSACMLAAIILCAMAAKQIDHGKVSSWAVSAVFLGFLLGYLFAGYIIAFWVKRREGIQTLSGRF
jgi:drug/metabolite transporter (DMT)-like permease